jgi:hypothetical protein
VQGLCAQQLVEGGQATRVVHVERS